MYLKYVANLDSDFHTQAYCYSVTQQITITEKNTVTLSNLI
jgi:hypothetical protein